MYIWGYTVGAVSWDTTLQVEMSRARFPKVSLEFFTDTILQQYDPGVDSACNRKEYQEYFLGLKEAGEHGWQSNHLQVPIVLLNLGS